MHVSHVILKRTCSTLPLCRAAKGEVVMGSTTSEGDGGCSLYLNGKCISCPSGCGLSTNGIPGSKKFKCQCICADGAKSCTTTDASGAGDQLQQQLDQSKQAIEDAKNLVANSKKEVDKINQSLKGRKLA